jgi:hypothetical protein
MLTIGTKVAKNPYVLARSHNGAEWIGIVGTITEVVQGPRGRLGYKIAWEGAGYSEPQYCKHIDLVIA